MASRSICCCITVGIWSEHTAWQHISFFCSRICLCLWDNKFSVLPTPLWQQQVGKSVRITFSKSLQSLHLSASSGGCRLQMCKTVRIFQKGRDRGGERLYVRQKFNAARALQSPDTKTSGELNIQLAMAVWNPPKFICMKRAVLLLDWLPLTPE